MLRILVFLLLLQLPGAAQPYRDPSGKFECHPPPSWKRGDGQATWKNATSSEAFNVGVVKTSETRLDKWAQNVVASHRERWDNLQQKDITLGGMKAKHIRGSKEARGHITLLELVLSVKGKTGVVLTFVTQRGEDPAFAKIVGGVTQSFRWR